MEALILLVILVVLGGPIAIVAVLVSMHRRLARLERETSGDTLGRLSRVENRVSALRDLLQAREGERAETRAGREEKPSTVVRRPVSASLPSPAPPAAGLPKAPSTPPPPKQPQTPQPVPSSVPASVAVSTGGSSTIVEDWIGSARIWLLGGNTVVRVGMIVVLFGVGFFLKYSFDQGWVSVQMRLMAAAAGGLALAALGWRLRESRPDFAWVVQGGGIGTVYLTVFAAANFYDLVSESLATILMIVLVTLASAMAVIGNALSLAVMATIGGFLAPVLVSSGGSHVALFAYYLVLDAGIVAIARFRPWRMLNLIGFFFTFLVGAAWGARYYRPEFLTSTEPFLIAFFLLYVAVPILFAARTAAGAEGSDRPGKGIVDGTLVFGTPLVAFGLQSLLVRDLEYGAAWSAIAAAFLYAALAITLWSREVRLYGLLRQAFVALAVAFATLAVPLAFDARWTGVAWALEGAGLVWVGVRQSQLLPRLAGLAMQLAASGAYFVAFQLTPEPESAVLNGIFVGAALMSAAGLASAWILRKEDLAVYPVATLAWGLLWWFGAGLNEIFTFVGEDDQIHALLLFATGSLALVVWLRRRLDWGLLAWPGLALLPVMVVSTLGLFATESHAFTASGLGVWAAAFALQYWLLACIEYRADWASDIIRLYHSVTMWLAIFLLSWEASWVMERAFPESLAWQGLAWIIVPLASLGVVPRLARSYSAFWPLASCRDTYISALMAPAAASVTWTLWASVQPGDPAPLPYLPVLNPLEMGQLGALLLVLAWTKSARSASGFLRQFLTLSNVRLTTAAAGFIALNGMIARAIHLYGGVPFRPGALWDSASYQAAVSIVWTLAALVVMVSATRWKRRALWATGASLLGLVVVKLFLVDLAGLETVPRIVSFLVVGSLILLIGYLSPLPPRIVERTS